jgi:hypothetical protein
MNFEKKHLLVIIGLGCLILAYCGSYNIPYTEYLPAIGGGAYALNFLTNLAK